MGNTPSGEKIGKWKLLRKHLYFFFNCFFFKRKIILKVALIRSVTSAFLLLVSHASEDYLPS